MSSTKRIHAMQWYNYWTRYQIDLTSHEYFGQNRIEQEVIPSIAE